jgi:hypothetical protein
MMESLLQAIAPLFVGRNFIGSLVLAIGATFIGAYFGGETGAAIAFFVTFPLVYLVMLFAPPEEDKKP